jgi:hypothetical protein
LRGLPARAEADFLAGLAPLFFASETAEVFFGFFATVFPGFHGFTVAAAIRK